MGGADTLDILAGVDHLRGSGPRRPGPIGVTGGSYGGFMACWLPVVDPRFAASVAISPVSDWFSERYESNLGTLGGASSWGATCSRAPGHYRDRSPVFRRRSASYADAPHGRRAGPSHPLSSGQAVEFHRVLKERGVPTEVVRYPLEGHGVRDLPAAIDLATRVSRGSSGSCRRTRSLDSLGA